MRMSNLRVTRKTLPNLPKRRPKLKKNLRRRKRPKIGGGEGLGRIQRAPRNAPERASRMKTVPEYKKKHKRDPVFALETNWTSDELSSLETDDEEKKTIMKVAALTFAVPQEEGFEYLIVPSFTALPFNSSGDEGLTACGDCGAALSVEDLRISSDVLSQPFECLSTGKPRERLVPPHHQCKPVVGVATTVRSFQDSDCFPVMLYIRPVPHLKPLGSAITSVFVSTFATLSVLWRIFSAVTEALAASEFSQFTYKLSGSNALLTATAEHPEYFDLSRGRCGIYPTCEGSDFDGVSDYEANLFVSAGEHKAPLHDASRQNSKIRMSIAISELQVFFSLVCCSLREHGTVEDVEELGPDLTDVCHLEIHSLLVEGGGELYSASLRMGAVPLQHAALCAGARPSINLSSDLSDGSEDVPCSDFTYSIHKLASDEYSVHDWRTIWRIASVQPRNPYNPYDYIERWKYDRTTFWARISANPDADEISGTHAQPP
ncbi:hypothetical protein DFH09DRAFT_1091666 [Mycena vulgaris]|nr:hypothetical protein DFH09DRAFT_1091666 [Mycena vulgaris]